MIEILPVLGIRSQVLVEGFRDRQQRSQGVPHLVSHTCCYLAQHLHSMIATQLSLHLSPRYFVADVPCKDFGEVNIKVSKNPFGSIHDHDKTKRFRVAISDWNLKKTLYCIPFTKHSFSQGNTGPGAIRLYIRSYKR